MDGEEREPCSDTWSYLHTQDMNVSHTPWQRSSSSSQCAQWILRCTHSTSQVQAVVDSYTRNYSLLALEGVSKAYRKDSYLYNHIGRKGQECLPILPTSFPHKERARTMATMTVIVFLSLMYNSDIFLIIMAHRHWRFLKGLLSLGQHSSITTFFFFLIMCVFVWVFEWI